MTSERLHALDVVFATHNGARTLPDVLEGYCQVRYPGRWRLIAVDNASTDETGGILERYADRLNILPLREERKGKNRALNKAIPFLLGDYAIFTDDDAVPCPDLLDSYNAVFNANPGRAVFAARIRPRWEREPEPWLLRAIPLGTAYSLNESRQDGEISPMQVYGPNMAVHRSLFEDGHAFNEAIGPCGRNYPMGSETEFCRRMAGEGHLPYFSAKPCVHHIIRRQQTELGWLLKRSFRNGRGAAAMDEEAIRAARVSLWGVPGWYLAGAARMLGGLLLSLAGGDKSEIFSRTWRLAGQAGRISQALLMRGAESGHGSRRQSAK